MVYSTIQKSQLEGAGRLDAEYYQPEFLEINKRLSKISHWDLGNHAFVTDGEHGSVSFEDVGIKYLTAENVSEGFLKLDDIRYVSELVDKRNKRASLEIEDITLSIKGTVGQAALVLQENLPANMNRDVSRIHIRDSIDPYFLTIFLNSKYGKGQTLRESSGNVQQMITLSRIRQLSVPRVSQQDVNMIRKLYILCYEQVKNSEKLYSMANKLLLEELGLKDFQVPEDLSYIVNYSNTQKAERIDADYFRPKYKELISSIGKRSSKTLGELVSMKKGFEPGSEAYQEEGKLFIRVSSLSKNGIEDKDQKYLSEELYQQLKNDFEPKIGEILLTKDASPGIAYVLKEPMAGIISGGILRLKTKVDIDPEYLALCINSVVGRMQADRDSGGSVIIHWKPEQIRNVLIPVLPKTTQQKISELVRQSHEARKKSRELLEEAKRKVEEMIEKGESNGPND